MAKQVQLSLQFSRRDDALMGSEDIIEDCRTDKDKNVARPYFSGRATLVQLVSTAPNRITI